MIHMATPQIKDKKIVRMIIIIYWLVILKGSILHLSKALGLTSIV